MLSYQDNDLSFEMKENGFGVCVRGCGCVGACVTNPTRKICKLIKLDLGDEDACIPYLKWKTYLFWKTIALGI